MERFPRGTLPPSAFEAIARSAVATQPAAVQPPVRPAAARPAAARIDQPRSTLQEPATPAEPPRAACDLASTCPNCSTMMQPEHAHYRCLTCGYRDSCCF
jgi:hypothetical protein